MSSFQLLKSHVFPLPSFVCADMRTGSGAPLAAMYTVSAGVCGFPLTTAM
jgi:hypothetical protein